MHKRIGILGGLSPESTITYYEYITRTYYARFGDYNYPEILIYSINFQEFVEWQREGRWDKAANRMVEALTALQRAGADFGVIATNTMHIVFGEVQERSPMPLISIIDATAEVIKREGVSVVGLLGTVFTMRESFYKDGLSRHGIKTLVPRPEDQGFIDRVIYEELTVGKILPDSRRGFLRIIEDLTRRGSQGIVLGCTEIPLLIGEEDCDARLFNTTTIHAAKALEYALRG